MADDRPDVVKQAPPRYKMRTADALADARRAKCLELIQAGWTQEAAALEVGWTGGARYLHSYQRKQHPNWFAQVQAATNHFRELKRGDTAEDEPFEVFVKRWFPERLPHKAHQVRIANILDTLEPRDVVMVLIWPEAGKTATLEDYICKYLAKDPTHRFSYVSEATDLAKRVLGTCSRRFKDEYWAPFQARFGPFYTKGQEREGRPWTTDSLMLANNPGSERDRNLVARSWTSAVYGSRIDTLVLDDLQSQKNLGQAEEIVRRIRGTFFNRGRELKTLIIGTRIGPGDFYERFLDSGLVTRQIVLPAVDVLTGEPAVPDFWNTTLTHKGGACCPPGIKRICPKNGAQLTPKEFMELIEFQSGPETWAASYLQNPRTDERSTFAEFLAGCLDHDRTCGPLVPA